MENYKYLQNMKEISNHCKRPQSIPPNNAYSSKFIPQSYSNSPSKSAKFLLTSPNPFNTYTHLSMLHPPTKSISTLISDSDNLQTTLNQHLLPTFHTLRSQISSKHSGMQFLEHNYQTHLNSLYSNLKNLNKAIQYSQIEHHKNTKEINETIDRLKEEIGDMEKEIGEQKKRRRKEREYEIREKEVEVRQRMQRMKVEYEAEVRRMEEKHRDRMEKMERRIERSRVLVEMREMSCGNKEVKEEKKEKRKDRRIRDYYASPYIVNKIYRSKENGENSDLESEEKIKKVKRLELRIMQF